MSTALVYIRRSLISLFDLFRHHSKKFILSLKKATRDCGFFSEGEKHFRYFPESLMSISSLNALPIRFRILRVSSFGLTITDGNQIEVVVGGFPFDAHLLFFEMFKNLLNGDLLRRRRLFETFSNSFIEGKENPF
ncbi:hypothetical protein CDAR_452501 [Caerostris darwini]|uniref:Ribosomal protein L5 n=1 Tax=Caerostris darwini TaxID=1538125 RepID=A0AAV4U7Y2_9ARAC|nr:hypothetical protein CDAR_452501 [Caerostris darwini]